jgi:hypothetical protein
MTRPAGITTRIEYGGYAFQRRFAAPARSNAAQNKTPRLNAVAFCFGLSGARLREYFLC